MTTGSMVVYVQQDLNVVLVPWIILDGLEPSNSRLSHIC